MDVMQERSISSSSSLKQQHSFSLDYSGDKKKHPNGVVVVVVVVCTLCVLFRSPSLFLQGVVGHLSLRAVYLSLQVVYLSLQ